MTKKKKGKRPAPYRAADGSRPPRGAARSRPSTTSRSDDADTPASEDRTSQRASSGRRTVDRRPRSRPADGRGEPRFGRTRRGQAAAIQLPRLVPSLTRTLTIVGANPILLATTFLGAFGLWLIYLSFGSVQILSPSAMAQMVALPPVHSYIDLAFVFGAGSRYSTGATIALGAALLLFRAVLLSFLIALISQALADPAPLAEEAGYLSEIRRAGARVIRMVAAVFLFETAFVVLLSFLGGLLGFLGLLGLALVMVAEMHYLLYVPIIAVTEQVRPMDALSLALRLVRQSTKQNLFFCSGYVLLTLFLLVLQAPFASASPSIQVWAFVLLASLVHVAVLAAIVLRWLTVREKVLEGWSPRPRTGWMGARVSSRSARRAP